MLNAVLFLRKLKMRGSALRKTFRPILPKVERGDGRRALVMNRVHTSSKIRKRRKQRGFQSAPILLKLLKEERTDRR